MQDGINAPFTEDAETATWLHDNHLDHLPIYANVIYSATGVAGNLDKPIIDANNLKPYFAVPWSKIVYPITDSMLQMHFNKILMAQDSAVLLIDYPSQFIADDLQQDTTHVIPLTEFTNANISDENFYVFLLKR